MEAKAKKFLSTWTDWLSFGSNEIDAKFSLFSRESFIQLQGKKHKKGLIKKERNHKILAKITREKSREENSQAKRMQ